MLANCLACLRRSERGSLIPLSLIPLVRRHVIDLIVPAAIKNPNWSLWYRRNLILNFLVKYIDSLHLREQQFCFDSRK